MAGSGSVPILRACLRLRLSELRTHVMHVMLRKKKLCEWVAPAPNGTSFRVHEMEGGWFEHSLKQEDLLHMCLSTFCVYEGRKNNLQGWKRKHNKGNSMPKIRYTLSFVVRMPLLSARTLNCLI